MLETHIFDTAKAIPQQYWDNLNCTANIYYSPQFLTAFELGNPSIQFKYVIITKKGNAIAFANTQLVKISAKAITKNIALNTLLKNTVNALFKNRSFNVLFCGNVFLSGEYGTFLKQSEIKPHTFNALSKGINTLAETTKNLHAVFIKDFLNASLPITQQLHNFNFEALKVEPNMVIHLKEHWKTFEDYKAALKSKYRVKVNKADKTSAVLHSYFFTVSDIETHLKQLQQLYQNTINNANFNAQVLNLTTYIHLKTAFPNQFYIKGYFYNTKLVGFLTAMKTETSLDAHFIGINYSENKNLAIYPRILNDYVHLGIATQSKHINLGRTASEIKSTLGAVPETLTCYFKHNNRRLNKALKPFIKKITIKTFKQHQPFKV